MIGNLLSCARIQSTEGQNYLAAMSAAANNYTRMNRSCITYLERRAFEKVFDKTAEEMEMNLVYDVCHNMAKIETHQVQVDEPNDTNSIIQKNAFAGASEGFDEGISTRGHSCFWLCCDMR